jgi:hypothetical protein
LFRELPNIEKSFRMSKSDRQGRPACRRKRDSIGARLTIDGFGITLHSLRRGLVGYEVTRGCPGAGLDRYVPPDQAEWRFVRN